jgi:transmembrane sensor
MSGASEIETVAARWLIRREEPDWSAADEARLQAWLDQSYANKAAYWRLECGWRKADRIGALGPEVAALSLPARSRWRDRGRLAIAASIGLLLIAVPVALHIAEGRADHATVVQYHTPLGGHEQVALADGSTVELNTATVIRAALTETHRDVWLDSGEAFFSVTHTGAPFVVHAGSRVVTVVGTKFSVSRDGDNVRVAVVEGKVRVSDSGGADPAPEATITRGDLLDADGSSTLLLQNASRKVEQSLAWRDGMLQFDRTPLSDVADQFNRYNRRKLVISDPTAAAIPIGGSFKASNVAAFARLLHEAYGLRVEYTPTEMKVSA